ncbi:MAG: hypothetical protein ACFFAS_13860 [Promethearchaeota archaeon]
MKKEISDLTEELRILNSNFKELSLKITEMISNMSSGIDKIAVEVHDANDTIKESMTRATNAVIDTTETIGNAFKILTLGNQAGNNIIKGLGIDNLIPDFMKKKKEKEK